MKRILIYIHVFLLLGACAKDDDTVKTSGEETLSSQLILSGNAYIVEGFILHGAKKVSYGPGKTPYPDLILENVTDISTTDVIGANLTSVQNDEAFFKVGEYASLNEAETAFQNLTDAGSRTFTPTAPNIKAYQVYIFKTRGDKYAKLLISSFQISPTKDYAEVTIKWVYQPSGETVFTVK